MNDTQKKRCIMDSLEDMPSDVLEMIYQIVYLIDSGLE